MSCAFQWKKQLEHKKTTRNSQPSVVVNFVPALPQTSAHLLSSPAVGFTSAATRCFFALTDVHFGKKVSKWGINHIYSPIYKQVISLISPIY